VTGNNGQFWSLLTRSLPLNAVGQAVAGLHQSLFLPLNNAGSFEKKTL
jgi:hypothetical protein